MICRRCRSLRLLVLEKKLPDDNDVVRCQDCGFLFSPPVSSKLPSDPPSNPPSGRSSRTAAVESGYRHSGPAGGC